MKSLINLLDDPEFIQLVPYVVENHSINSTIVEEDEEGRDVYLILEGHAHVQTYIEDKTAGLTTGLAKLGEGDMFGELSMFDGEPRSAFVTAATNCLVVHFDGPKLIQYMDSHPGNGYFILKDMFEHLVAHMRQNNIRAKTALQLYLTEQSS